VLLLRRVQRMKTAIAVLVVLSAIVASASGVRLAQSPGSVAAAPNTNTTRVPRTLVPSDRAYLRPNPDVSLAVALRVKIPTSITLPFHRKKVAIDRLLRRLHRSVEEVHRLRKLNKRVNRHIRSEFDKMTILSRNYRKLYRAHQLATRGTTMDDKKIDKASLLPLVQVSKQLVKQHIKHIVSINRWIHAIPMNEGQRLALKKMVLRLQRKIGLFMVEATRLPSV